MNVDFGAPLAELDRIGGALDRMAAGDADAEVMDAGAERGEELLLATWSEQAAPDGVPWAAPARDYGHPLLDASGDMKATAKVYPVAFALNFIIADDKALWHQRGTERGGVPHIPARQMIFEESERPERWITGLEEAMQARLNRWITEEMGGT